MHPERVDANLQIQMFNQFEQHFRRGAHSTVHTDLFCQINRSAHDGIAEDEKTKASAFTQMAVQVTRVAEQLMKVCAIGKLNMTCISLPRPFSKIGQRGRCGVKEFTPRTILIRKDPVNCVRNPRQGATPDVSNCGLKPLQLFQSDLAFFSAATNKRLVSRTGFTRRMRSVNFARRMLLRRVTHKSIDAWKFIQRDERTRQFSATLRLQPAEKLEKCHKRRSRKR